MFRLMSEQDLPVKIGVFIDPEDAKAWVSVAS